MLISIINRFLYIVIRFVTFHHVKPFWRFTNFILAWNFKLLASPFITYIMAWLQIVYNVYM